jgi:hypothetical protein
VSALELSIVHIIKENSIAFFMGTLT